MSDPPGSDALRAVLLAVPTRVPIDQLERIWVFPPKEIANRESGLLVLVLLPLEAAARGPRRLITIRYERERTRKPPPPSIRITEEGRVPADRVSRVISGVVSRLRDGEDPSEHAVLGRLEEWAAVLEHYGVRGVDPRKGE